MQSTRGSIRRDPHSAPDIDIRFFFSYAYKHNYTSLTKSTLGWPLQLPLPYCGKVLPLMIRFWNSVRFGGGSTPSPQRPNLVPFCGRVLHPFLPCLTYRPHNGELLQKRKKKYSANVMDSLGLRPHARDRHNSLGWSSDCLLETRIDKRQHTQRPSCHRSPCPSR